LRFSDSFSAAYTPCDVVVNLWRQLDGCLLANEIAVSQTTSSAATYQYGLDGQRLEKALPESYPLLYQYNHAGGELLSENDLHQGQTADYIYLNGRPIGEVNPTTGKLYFTHTDRLGTPQRLTDSTQAVAWSATYRPFGNTVSFSGTLSTQSLRLPGQQFDPETGYNHNGFRDYAGGLTRYVESDPIGLVGGLNTYAYAGANPQRFEDPLGLDGSFTGDVSEVYKAFHSFFLDPIDLIMAPREFFEGLFASPEELAASSRNLQYPNFKALGMTIPRLIMIARSQQCSITRQAFPSKQEWMQQEEEALRNALANGTSFIPRSYESELKNWNQTEGARAPQEERSFMYQPDWEVR
jgi:RHS repeat-associated protein